MLIAAKRAPAAALRILGTCSKPVTTTTSMDVRGGVRDSSAMYARAQGDRARIDATNGDASREAMEIVT